MADDFLNNPEEQGFPSELDTASPYSGNRPASGSRRATPGEVLSQGFQGAQNAGDFLGLDTEFTDSQDPHQAYGSSLDLVPPPTLGGDGGQGYDPSYGQVPAPAPLPEGDAVQEFAEAPSAFEFGEDLGSDEGEFAPLSEPVSSRKPLLVGVLLAAALGAGGLFYGPTLFSRYFGAQTEVARTPTHSSQPVTSPKPAPVVSEPTGETPLVGSLPVVEPVASTPEPVTEPAPVVSSRTPGTRREPRPPQPEVVAPSVVESGPQGGEGTQSLAALGALPSASSPSFPDLSGPGFEWASEDRLELIWRGSEVPLEAVKAPAKTIMPRVGNVRVFTTTGDVFDGRLYAVGQNRVWLDTEPGRVGLDGDKVERIEVLPPLPEGTKTGGELLAGSKRVRVRVPGGMLYGHVLKQEGDDVTLALTDGGRVRVKSSDLEDLGPGRAIVVGR